MGKLFGTDGVRGIANKDLTPALAFKLARAGVDVLARGKKRPKFVLGTDTRLSSDMLESAMIAGLCSVGCDVIPVGVVPTPAVAYLIRYYGAEGGAMVSASHNPAEYNGIKFFDGKGYKLDDSKEKIIENKVFQIPDKPEPPLIGADLGRNLRRPESIRYYADFLKNTLSHSFKGLRLGVDCANGAAYKVAPLVLEELGASIRVINDRPDGLNINARCGSTDPGALAALVREEGLDLGLAFDGDADRLIAVDERGNIIDGDYIMAICARRLKEQGSLAKDTIVTTVMSNLGLHEAMESIKCSIEETPVGDKYVLERMIKKGYNFGGEQSGHIIFFDHNTTGDGLLTALQLIDSIKHFGESLSKLCSTVRKYPQVLVNAKVKDANKKAYWDDRIISDEVKRVKERLKNNGRLLIRPSGTEPFIRVMLEGGDIKQLEQYARNLAELIENRLA